MLPNSQQLSKSASAHSSNQVRKWSYFVTFPKSQLHERPRLRMLLFPFHFLCWQLPYISHPHVHTTSRCTHVLIFPVSCSSVHLGQASPLQRSEQHLLPKEMRSKTKAMLLPGRKSLGALTSHVDYINFNHPRISSWKPSIGTQPRGRREGCSSIGSWLD